MSLEELSRWYDRARIADRESERTTDIDVLGEKAREVPLEAWSRSEGWRRDRDSSEIDAVYEDVGEGLHCWIPRLKSFEVRTDRLVEDRALDEKHVLFRVSVSESLDGGDPNSRFEEDDVDGNASGGSIVRDRDVLRR